MNYYRKDGCLMKILTDFHHPDLYWSFVLTMERRLGWEVYRVIGMEWFDKGYWQFEKFWAGNRFAKMFLALDPTNAPGDQTNPVRKPDRNLFTHWIREDERHPGYDIKMVTIEQAREIEFDYVMATVPHNQEGFKRFADEIGAGFIVQVGNAEHNIDWSLDPIVLNSTARELKGKTKSLDYDQEIDPSFSYEPLPEKGEIASFHIDWNQQNLDMFFEVAAHLPMYEFQSYGNLGLYLIKTADVAQKMKESRILWHTKHVGDGWGHVIHGAMAIGRPLIGKKSYYKNRIAWRCWTPANSIDIEGMSPRTVAVELQSAMEDPDRLQLMGMASRDIWERYIDYERDAESIERLLT